MVDKQKLYDLIAKSFPNASPDAISRIAQEITMKIEPYIYEIGSFNAIKEKKKAYLLGK